VCTYGTRSGKAVTLLRARGFERVASLHDGLIGWRAAGYPTVGGLAAMSDRQDTVGWEGMNI
jgi:rhodanese-related sulfurtransferase